MRRIETRKIKRRKRRAAAEHAIHICNVRRFEAREIKRCQLAATVEHDSHALNSRGIKARKVNRLNITKVAEHRLYVFTGMNGSLDLNLGNSRFVETIPGNKNRAAAIVVRHCIERALDPVGGLDGEHAVVAKLPHAGAARAACGCRLRGDSLVSTCRACSALDAPGARGVHLIDSSTNLGSECRQRRSPRRLVSDIGEVARVRRATVDVSVLCAHVTARIRCTRTAHKRRTTCKATIVSGHFRGGELLG